MAGTLTRSPTRTRYVGGLLSSSCGTIRRSQSVDSSSAPHPPHHPSSACWDLQYTRQYVIPYDDFHAAVAADTAKRVAASGCAAVTAAGPDPSQKILVVNLLNKVLHNLLADPNRKSTRVLDPETREIGQLLAVTGAETLLCAAGFKREPTGLLELDRGTEAEVAARAAATLEVIEGWASA